MPQHSIQTKGSKHQHGIIWSVKVHQVSQFFWPRYKSHDEPASRVRRRSRLAWLNTGRNFIWSLKIGLSPAASRTNLSSALTHKIDRRVGAVMWLDENQLVLADVSAKRVLFYTKKHDWTLMRKILWNGFFLHILLNRCTTWPGLWSKSVKKAFFISARL